MDISFLSEDLKQRYLARRFQDVQDCFIRLPNQDWDYFERLGHQIKGNATSYGFADLQIIALKIEAHAREKDFSNLQMTLDEFKTWVLHKKFET
jgi:HPt (histidine-containing phosphotransfer) domain-containing protein